MRVLYCISKYRAPLKALSFKINPLPFCRNPIPSFRYHHIQVDIDIDKETCCMSKCPFKFSLSYQRVRLKQTILNTFFSLHVKHLCQIMSSSSEIFRELLPNTTDFFKVSSVSFFQEKYIRSGQVLVKSGKSGQVRTLLISTALSQWHIHCFVWAHWFF